MENRTPAAAVTTTLRLYEAAFKGDVPSLHNLLEEDSLILDRCIVYKSGQFMQSPLHVAVKLGHLDFVTIILKQKPELAEELDSKMSSPLHIASAKGHLEIVKALLDKLPDMCFVRDYDGRNPVHVAAIKGKTDVLQVLFQAEPQVFWERTKCGETVLHLCIKHSQPKALQFFSDNMHDRQFVNSKNSDGNTVLHLAVAFKQVQMVEYILKNKLIDINAENKNGFTAMDTLKNQSGTRTSDDKKIRQSLKSGKAKLGKDVLKDENSSKHGWLEKQRNAIMVVASLIATMCFQVGINPPGGAWQDFIKHDNGTQITNYFPGSSIMSDMDVSTYSEMLISNTIGSVSSLSVILLLISGLPCNRRRLFIGILMVAMWVAVSATTYTYLVAISYLIMDTDADVPWLALRCSLRVWLGLMGLLLLAHAGRFIGRRIKKSKCCCCCIDLWKLCFSRSPSHPPLTTVFSQA